MSRSISCGHCGGQHASVAEVRSCSLGSPSSPSAAIRPEGLDAKPTGSIKATTRRTDPVSSASAELPGDVSAEALAGPAPLGRSVLLGPNDPVPAPWAEPQVPEVKADREAGSDLIERLHTAWRQRERLVIRWSGPLPDGAPPVDKPFHELDVAEELPGERLAFAVTANTIDARDRRCRFAPLAAAIDAGAVLADAVLVGDARADPESGGDVILADGASAWVDGGPVDLDLPDAVGGSVIPRCHLVAGSLVTLGGRPEPAAQLAPDQLAAVAHGGGPARILAPAGSGKTRVLTERARHLVNDCGISPRAVSLVAYNRRAKDEMQARLGDVPGLEIRTLNSMALAVATGRGPFRSRSMPAPDLTTIGELEVRRLLDRVVPGRRRKKLTDPLEPWVDALSACRLGLRDPTEVEAMYGGDVAGFPDVLVAYRSELERAGLMDFDEQILRAIDRLLKDPEARMTARSVAPILLVDEFQDLTPAHLVLLRLIAGPAGELFGVGDDDQTIYGYAGASPDWLIDFNRFFPGAADHRLTVNYRCPADVVDGAVSLLSHNRRRVLKEIVAGAGTGIDNAPGDAGLEIVNGDPQISLTNRVTSLLESGASPHDIAVLARVNAALLPAAIHLDHAGVPVVRPHGMGPEVLDRSGVGAALSWLRLATGPAQGLASDDLRLALRRPPRSLHPRVADWVCEQRSVKDLIRLSERLNTEKEAEAVAGLAADLEALRTAADGGADTATLLAMVYEDVGLLGAASQLDRSQRSARRAAHADELSALVSVAPLHPDPSSFEGWLRSRLDALPRPDDGRPADAADDQVGRHAETGARSGVTLATIHTTKGLEWPHVVVHDVRDGLYPHRLADDIEEERRVFHVGVTRGRQSVTVTVSGPPSPFVSQLTEARPADLAWPEAPVVSDSAPTKRNSGGSGAATRAARTEPASRGEADLRDALTTWRRDRSKTDGVPAYVVLDNKTLDAIAAARPQSLGQLGSISGIGPAKLERYGSDILGVVASVEATDEPHQV